MKVAIIGAGATGLAAAYELSSRGHVAVVYERSPFLGGQASTFDVGGTQLERGYHHLFTGDTDILDLIDKIGLSDRMFWVESKVGTLFDGKIYDFVTPVDLLKFTPLSLVDRFRIGLVTLRLRLTNDWRALEGISADAWLRQHVGKRGYEVFWGPMLRGKFGEDFYREIGMAWVWGKIHTRFASRGRGMAKESLGYPIGSFDEVFDVLAQRIRERGNEVHTSASVRRIVVEDGCVTGMQVTLQGEESSFHRFDGVIATVPSYIFPKLVPPLPEDYLSRLTSVNYMAAVLIILVLKHPLSHIYWLNVADRSIPFVGVIEQTNLIPAEHYGGKHIVYLSNYLSTSHPLYKLDKDELIQEYLPHLRKINPDFEPSWIETSYHHRVDAAQPIIGTNYSSRMPDHRTPFKGVYLANTTQVYPEDRGTNYSVKMGRRVVEMVMEDLS